MVRFFLILGEKYRHRCWKDSGSRKRRAIKSCRLKQTHRYWKEQKRKKTENRKIGKARERERQRIVSIETDTSLSERTQIEMEIHYTHDEIYVLYTQL